MRHRNVAAAWTTSLFLIGFILSVQGLPARARASTTVEMSPSNGSSMCPSYLGGPGALSAVWNASTSTCTVNPNPNVGPTVCIGSGGGCVEAPADVFVVDSGVTVVVNNQSKVWAQFCVYSTLVNKGTVIGGSFCDYGTIVNYGEFVIPRGNFFWTDSSSAVFLNEKGGTVVNDYHVVDGSNVTNYGTFYNRGIFDNSITDAAGVIEHGTFTNHGDFIGSAPCFTYEGCHTWIGTYNITSGTMINMFLNGVILSFTGASGTGVTVSSENQTTAAPLGLGSLNMSSVSYYDVFVSGLSRGTAHLCIANSRVTQSMVGGLQYWNGNQWTFAQNQNVSKVPTSLMPPLNASATTTTTMPNINMLCGDIPVVELNGTPIGAGTPMHMSQQTTTAQTTTAQLTTSAGKPYQTTALSLSTPSGSSLTVLLLGGALVFLLAIGLLLSRRRGVLQPLSPADPT